MNRVAAYFMLLFIVVLILLYLYKPEIFYRIMDYRGPGSPFVQPPSY